jgi:hypothetical protein
LFLYRYGKGDKYAQLLQEDEEIRDLVFKYVRKNVRTPTNYGGVVKVGPAVLVATSYLVVIWEA